MSREISILVYHRDLFNAHWYIYVPHPTKHKIGTLIHVTGSVAQGFTLQFKRHWDLAATSSSHTLFPIGSVDVSYLGEDADELVIDSEPRSEFEKIAASVPAPGPSLRSSTSTRVVKIEQKDCQWWVKQVVDTMITAGTLPPSAAEAVASVPQH